MKPDYIKKAAHCFRTDEETVEELDDFLIYMSDRW